MPPAASIPENRIFRYRLRGCGEPQRLAAVTLPQSDSLRVVIRVEPWSNRFIPVLG
ncbi:MAG: hypothetical protein ACOX6P_05820 [Candidatus Merdivicinus sp.]